MNKLTVNSMYDTLLELELVSEDALDLVISINGFSEQTMLDVLFAQTGLRDFEQLAEEYE